MSPSLPPYKFFKELATCPFVQEIWLFGSRARKDAQKKSDIDLAIFCPQATERDWFNIIEIIENADTLLEIDIIRLDELCDHSPLKSSILSQGTKIYEKR